MSLPVPKLDDIDFEELVELARGLIPRYAPEWTDHNLHDPGMTLLDFLCWIVDQQVWETGFVNDRHLLAFAALFGIRPRFAAPASGLVWPDDTVRPAASRVQQGYELVAGAKVRSDDLSDLSFELEGDVFVTGARIAIADVPVQARLLTLASTDRQDALIVPPNETSAIELLLDRPLLGDNQASSAALTLGFDLQHPDLGDAIVRGSVGRIAIDYRLELPGETWRRADIVEDRTAALNRSGIIRFRAMPAPAGTPQDTQCRLRVLTRHRLNPMPVQVNKLSLNVLPVLQRETREPAPLLALSNGLPNQSFELDVRGILDDRGLETTVLKDGETSRWTRIGDLDAATPRQRVFEVDRDQNRLNFGNGINGRIPLAGAEITHGRFQVCSGASGNVAANFTWNVAGAALADGQNFYGRNRVAFTGGRDADDVQSILPRLRERALSRHGLVTNSDLAEAASRLAALAVDRAEVLPRFDPALPGRSVAGSRTLVVVPDRASSRDALEATPAAYRRAVETALANCRVLGERLHVVTPERVAIRVRTLLVIEDGAVPEDVIATATARLNARLSDVRTNPDIEPWPTGRSVRRSEIRALLATSPGVIAVAECSLSTGEDEFADEDIQLSRLEIAIGAQHQVSTRELPARGGH